MADLDNAVPTSLEASEQGSADQAATLASQDNGEAPSQAPTTIESQEAASASQVETLANTSDTPAYIEPEKKPELQTITVAKPETIQTPDGYIVKKSDADKIAKQSPMLYDILIRNGYQDYLRAAESTSARLEEETRYGIAKSINKLPLDVQRRLMDAYSENGIEGYNQAVKELNIEEQTKTELTTINVPKSITENKVYDEATGKFITVTPEEYAKRTAYYSDEERRQNALSLLSKYRLPAEGISIAPFGMPPAMSDKYNIVKYIEDNLSDVETAKKILLSAGFKAKDIDTAWVVATGSKVGGLSAFKGEMNPPNLFGQTALKLEAYQQELAKNKTKTGLLPTAAEGAFVAGVEALTAIPILASKATSNPSGALSLAGQTVVGLGQFVATTAKNLVSGKYIADIKMGDASNLVHDTIMTYLIAEGGVRAGKAALSKVTLYVLPRGEPFSVIGKEASTGRLPNIENATKATADAINKVEQLAMTKGGKFTEDVPIEGTAYKFRLLKTPIEQVAGNIVFHGTQDVIDASGKVLKESLLRVMERGEKATPQAYFTSNSFERIKLLADKIPQDVANVDVPAIRTLNFADATDVPKKLVPQIQSYITRNDGKVYGSFVEWLKIDKAKQPHDIDVVFGNNKLAINAREYFKKLAEREGYEARANDRGVQIKQGDKWVTFINIVSRSQHAEMLKGIIRPKENIVDGIQVETIGSQAVMQRLGSLAGDAKSAIRETRLKAMSGKVTKAAESEGVSIKQAKAELNTILIGEGGLYTDPWAAIGYTRGGKNPALVMVITDANKLKSGAEGLAKGETQSAKFIQDAQEGFYGSSKMWRGDFETEIVAAPKTALEVPKPMADLATRVLAGKYSDYVTYDNGRFVPIKIAIDKGSTNITVPTIAQLYGAKLLTLQNALRDTSEALKHPDLVLKDISGTFKAMADLPEMFGSGAGKAGSPTFFGVRDVYLLTDWGEKLRMMSEGIYNKALKRTQRQAKVENIKEDSAIFRRMLERNMDDVYRGNARALLRQYKDVSTAYAASHEAKSKFEDAYLASLGLSIESAFKSSSVSSRAVSDIIKDIRSESKIASSVFSAVPVSSEGISRSSESTRSPETSEIRLVESSVSTPESLRTPESIRSGESITSGGSSSSSGDSSSSPPSESVPPQQPRLVEIQTKKATIEKKTDGEAFVTFKQGLHWVKIKAPYQQDDISISRRPPKGATLTGERGKTSPQRTIQLVGDEKLAPVLLTIDIGNKDAIISHPARKPGKAGALRYRNDKKNKTVSDVTITGVRL